jgi:hypothetical protein
VRAAVVEDQVQFDGVHVGAIDLLEEIEKLPCAVLFRDPPEYVAGRDIECGVEARRSVPLVVVRPPLDLARPDPRLRPGRSWSSRVRNLDIVENFLASVAAFCQAAPWRFWCDNDPLTLSISSKEYEACIMGAGGQEYGVALYDRRGAVKKLARLIDAGRMRDAAAFGNLAVT